MTLNNPTPTFQGQTIEWSDLEMLVWGCSRSLEMARFADIQRQRISLTLNICEMAADTAIVTMVGE